MGADSLQDYELIGLLLHYSIPRKDTKPLAKHLLEKFKSIEYLIHASPDQVLAIDGIGEATVVQLQMIRRLRQRMIETEIASSNVLSSWQAVIDYCRSKIGFEDQENFAVLLLNSLNELIIFKILAKGTVNKVTAYPREIARLALENNAVSVVLVHNHPSGNTTPSKQDIEMTRNIRKVLMGIDVTLHDHLIISPGGETSFKTLGLLE